MYFHYHLHWKPRFLSASDATLKDDISRIIWSLEFLTTAHTCTNCQIACHLFWSPSVTYTAPINREPKNHTNLHRQVFLKSLFSCRAGSTRNPPLCSAGLFHYEKPVTGHFRHSFLSSDWMLISSRLYTACMRAH